MFEMAFSNFLDKSFSNFFLLWITLSKLGQGLSQVILTIGVGRLAENDSKSDGNTTTFLANAMEIP